MVPAGYELQLQIFPGMNVYACTTPLYSQGLGMFTENTSLTVTATLSSQQFQENIITVTGIANDCSGLPLQSGTVFIQSGNYYTYASVTNGSYSTLLDHCDAVPSITISISDNNTTAIAAPVIVTTTGNTAVVPLVTLTCGLTLNPLDGIYEISGSFVDAGNPAFVVQYPRAYHLITNGPFSVIVAQNVNNEIAPGILFYNGTGGSFYGNFGIQATFDLTNNSVTELHNYYGDPLNPATGVGDPALGSGAPNYISGGVSLRSASLDPTGFNDYNPVARVIRIKYLMYQSTFSPGPRCTFDETWTYIGPR